MRTIRIALALLCPTLALSAGCHPAEGIGDVQTNSRALAATLPYVTGFETGALDACWTTNSTNQGRIRVASTNGPRGGFHMLMDDSVTAGSLSLNEATLTLDTTGASGLRLRFFAREYGDEGHVLPPTFTGSSNGDGVAISADGTNWSRIVDLSTGLTSTYQAFDVDLDAAVAAASISYGPNFRIRFSQYDDYPISTDGIAFDDVTVADQLADIIPPTGTIAIDSGAATTITASVALTLTATDTQSGVADMSFSNDQTTWSPWEAFATTRSWDLTDASAGGNTGSGTKTVYARYRDGAQIESAPVSDTIVYAPPAQAAAFPFTDDFESGGLGPWWRSMSTSAGRIRVSSLNGPAASGTRHVLMDTGSAGYALNELELTVDLTGRTGVFLIFFARDFSDETESLPATFTGSSNGDGVAISQDGVNWFRVVDIGRMINSSYGELSVDLDAAIASAGIAYNSTFRIKFTQYDNASITTDGIAYDNIQVIVPPPDTTPPTGTLRVANGVSSTPNRIVALNVTGADTGRSGLSEMRFSNDGTTWSTWETFATTRNGWDLTAAQFGGTVGTGTKNVRMQLRDGAGNVSTTISDSITLAPPSTICGALTDNTNIGANNSSSRDLIVGDAQYVWDGYDNRYLDDYTLGVQGIGPVTVNVSSATFDPIVYVYTSAGGCVLVGRDLNSGTGTAARLTFNATPGTYRIVVSTTAGATLGSYTLSTTSMLVDTVAPTGTVRINSGAASTSIAAVTLSLNATDVGGSGLASMQFSNNGTTWSTLQTYSAARTGWDITSAAFGGTATAGTKTVYARFRDGAGNVSTAVQDTITFQPPTPASFPFTEGWEGGSLRSMWSGVTSTNGRIRVTTANGPNSGSYHVVMDSSRSSTFALNELTLTINLSGRNNVRLRFASRDYGDDTHTLPTSFTGSRNGDGVAISADGNTWYRVWDGPPAVGATYATFDIDLDQAIANARIAYNSTFQIRFSQYDNNSATTDGYAFDDIQVSSVTPDTTRPTGTISIAAGAASTTSLTVTLNLSATDAGGSGLADMRFSNNGTTWSSWQAYSTSRTGWSLSSFGGNSSTGTKRTYAQYRDGAGNISNSVSDTISYNVPDTTSPTGAVQVNSGAASTASLIVTLNLAATDSGGSGLASMQFSNNGTTWTSFEAYRTTRTSWDLTRFGGSSATGTKRVYARFRDGAGNVSASVSDTISYALPDSTAPTGTVRIAGGAASTTNAAVTLSLSASDSGGSGLADMQFSNDGTRWSPWERYTTLKSGWDMTSSAFGGSTMPGMKAVFARFRDGANNVSAPSSDTIVYMPADTTAPTAPGNLVATAVAANRIELRWTSATDNNGVIAYAIERSVDGVQYSDLTSVSGTATRYSDRGLQAGVTLWYRARAIDMAMNAGPYSNVATASTPGAQMDAGVIADADTPTDTGTATTTPDAGFDDAGNPIDAGPAPDGGIVRTDARTTGNTGGSGGATSRRSSRRGGGCECVTGAERDSLSMFVLLLAAGALVMGRRRRG